MAFRNDRHPETGPVLFIAATINHAKEPTISSSHLTDSSTTQFNEPRRVWGTSSSSMTLLLLSGLACFWESPRKISSLNKK